MWFEGDFLVIMRATFLLEFFLENRICYSPVARSRKGLYFLLFYKLTNIGAFYSGARGMNELSKTDVQLLTDLIKENYVNLYLRICFRKA